MSRADLTSLIDSLGDLLGVLANADPADKAEVYRDLGLRLTYQPSRQTIQGEIKIDPRYRGVMVGVRGGT